MTTGMCDVERPGDEAFCHEALLYSGPDGFLAGTVPFLRDAVAAEEPALVVVSPGKIDLLRAALGDDAEAVAFADMGDVGRNPARIIPAWQAFVDRHGPNRRLRGIGEPVWPGRRGPELTECVRHEALLNVAFDGQAGWSLLCPYDTSSLDRDVVEAARRTHPVVRVGTDREASDAYSGEDVLDVADDPLPEPPGRAEQLHFTAGPLDGVRRHVADHAARAGVDADATEDLVLAVNEIATNSVRYGGGGGVLRVWRDLDALVCEVRDAGHVTEPLVGRQRPPTDAERGRGLWMVNQLCDLMQLRSFDGGTVVRLHTWLAGRQAARP